MEKLLGVISRWCRLMAAVFLLCFVSIVVPLSHPAAIAPQPEQIHLSSTGKSEKQWYLSDCRWAKTIQKSRCSILVQYSTVQIKFLIRETFRHVHHKETLSNLVFMWWKEQFVANKCDKCSHSPFLCYNGILVPVRTSFGLRRRGGKTYNVSM